MRLLRTTGTLLSAALAASGCSFITGVHGTSRVTVTISPNVIGLNQQAQAIGTAFDGSTPLSGNSRYTVTYSSRDPNVATVDEAHGVVTGKAYGQTYIVAENRGVRDSATITVRPVQAVQLIIGNKTPTYRVGAQNFIGASAFDSAGRAIGDRSVTWTSRNTAVLTISPIGAVAPLTAGTAWVVASIDNGPGAKPALDSTLATVTPVPVGTMTITPNNTTTPNLTIYVGQTLQFSVAITDSLRNPATRTVTWTTSDNGSILAIDPQSGLARGVSQTFGSTNVVATAPLVPGDPSNQVARASISVAVLSPADSTRVFNGSFGEIATITVAKGSTTPLNLVAIDVLRNALPGRTFAQSSSNSAVASVPPTSSGSTQITAGPTAGTATLTFQALDASGNGQGRKSTLTVTVQ